MNEGRARRLRSHVDAGGDRVIVGHVVDLEALETRFVVELWLDGWPVRLTRANLFDDALFRESIGDGCYKFRFVLEAAMAKSGGMAEARLANSGESLGLPIAVGASREDAIREAEVRGSGGLRLEGWVGASASDPSPLIVALVDGSVVAEVRADHWIHSSDAVASTPVRAFEIDLPLEFADGRARRVRVADENGAELPGSPVSVLAFADGLERFCADRAEIESERPRGAIYDALFPRSHPMRDFAGWSRRFPMPEPQLAGRPKVAVALIGAADPGASLESLEAQRQCDWTAVGIGADGSSAFAVEDLQALVAQGAGVLDFLVFAPSGVVFHPCALARFAAGFEAHPDAEIVYGDLTILAASGEDWPIAFTAFDYERMLEQGYAGLCFAARSSHVRAAAAANVADVFSLFLFALEPETPAVPVVAHAPGFLARLPALDLDATGEALRRAVEAHLAVRRKPAAVEVVFSGRFPALKVQRRPAAGRVSVIVTTKDSLGDLKEFFKSLEQTTVGTALDITIVDVDSSSRDVLDHLEEIAEGRVRFARMAGPYQPERAFNAASNIATGEFLLFCTDYLRAPREGWLRQMLGRLAEPDVGAVTPMLLWPGGIVQQCGLVVGPDFAVSRAFRDAAGGELGYGEMLGVAHEVGAATAVGMLTRRQDFLDHGGFDFARFGLKHAAVDYCLKLRASGRRIVATPHVQLVASRLEAGPELGSSEVGDRAWRELETLRFVWGRALENDPLYSPLLALTGAPFSALAWPPRGLEPRLPTLPKAKPWPEGG